MLEFLYHTVLSTFFIVKKCSFKHNWWNILFHSTFGYNTGFIFAFFVKTLTKATAAPSIGDTKLDYIYSIKDLQHNGSIFWYIFWDIEQIGRLIVI